VIVGNHWPEKRRVTVVGAVVNVGLAASKVAGGIVGQSQALIADGVHSLSDLASDVLVLLAARFGSREADHNHPYGHERIETLATLGVGLILIVSGAAFLFDSVSRLLEPARQLSPGWLALGLALLSVLIKEGLYHYTARVARRTDSALLLANAWHHRSDALSSVVVIIGVAGAMMGMRWLDSVAAAIVGVMLGWVGWSLLGSAATELVDTGLSNRELKALSKTIDGVEDVRSHDQLRSRRMGGRIFVDVRIHVDPDLSVAQAEVVSRRVAERMIEQLPGQADVVISIASGARSVK
jgi:cation diffusion facilitator family transporter